MDLQMFQKHAKRTMNTELGPNMQLAVMALGINGELGEVTHIYKEPEKADHLAEEVGDIFWYVANTCTCLGFDWSLLFQPRHADYANDVMSLPDALDHTKIWSGSIADVIKKTVGHGHLLDIDTIYDSLKRLVEALLAILFHFGKDLGSVLETNQMKLMKRYPKGFSTERSVNREV